VQPEQGAYLALYTINTTAAGEGGGLIALRPLANKQIV
jgi:hypothetical protein